MRVIACSLALAALLGPAVGRGPAQAPEPPRAAAGASGEPGALEFLGRTLPAPGRSGKLAPVVLHPVEEVLVALGARVKKGQPLVRIDDDEPRAEVRAKRAALGEQQAGLARLRAEPRQA